MAAIDEQFSRLEKPQRTANMLVTNSKEPSLKVEYWYPLDQKELDVYRQLLKNNYIRKNFPLEPGQRIFKVRVEPSIKNKICTCTKPALHTVLTRINDKRMHRMIDLMAEFCQECFEKNVEIVH